MRRFPPICALLAGCMASAPAPPVEPSGEPAASDEARAQHPASAPPLLAPDAEVCSARSGEGVRREAVVRAIDAGLGVWLRGVSVRPKLEEGRFRGWIVQRFYPGDVCYSNLDIREGDVVTRVNGRSVERDHQAHAVFVALRTAPEIVVEYERVGSPRKLRVAIVDR